MELIPLEHMSERPSGEFPSDHTVPNANRDLVLTIYCMKVSWLVFSVEDRDDDAKKSTKLWHSFHSTADAQFTQLRITINYAACLSPCSLSREGTTRAVTGRDSERHGDRWVLRVSRGGHA